jgi:hypothetical protein
MWEERKLRLLENRVLRRVFGSKRDEVTESGENCIMSSLMIGILHHIFFGDQTKKNGIGGAGSTYAGE